MGAGGKVGSTICRTILESGENELVAAVDPRFAGIDLGQVVGKSGVGLIVSRDVRSCVTADAEVAIDFTEARGSFTNLLQLAQAKIPAVVGTTGFSDSEIGDLEKAFQGAKVGCVIASNFSIGAILMMRCAELCAPYFDSVEIVEMHHNQKLDAPSGTSLEIARRINLARGNSGAGVFMRDATSTFKIDGARGAEVDGPIRVHSLRLVGPVAHHEVIMGTVGQTISIRHDSFDRASFVPGVMLAVNKVQSLDRLVLGIERFLD